MRSVVRRCAVCDDPADFSCTARDAGFECVTYRCRKHPCSCRRGIRRRLWGHREWISRKPRNRDGLNSPGEPS